MHCCIIYKEDYPWDVRVEKLAKSLLDAGHKVTIVCRNLDQRDNFDIVDGVEIVRLPRIKWLPRSIVKFINAPLWFSPIWLYTILKLGRPSPKLYIIRDLPLALSGIICSWFTGSKVMLDMAEVYPEMYASSIKFSKSSFAKRAFKNPHLAGVYERLVLRLVDHVFVMIEESRDRLLRKGVPNSKVTIVSNTPPLEKYSGRTVSHAGDSLRLVYVGFLTRLRGLDVLIRAIRVFLDKTEGGSIFFDVVGKGAARQELKDLVEELKLQEHVTIHGWLEQEKVDELLDAANVGALTYRVCGHWNHTIPNKIFDYMLAGLPVLTTNVVPISRIIEKENCGIVCQDQNPTSIADGLIKLRAYEIRAELGTNGHQSIIESYNWRNDEKRLISCVEGLNEG